MAGDEQQQHPHDNQMHSSPHPSPAKDDMIGYVMALEAALLPCLPARELQAIDRSPHPSHQSKLFLFLFIIIVIIIMEHLLASLYEEVFFLC